MDYFEPDLFILRTAIEQEEEHEGKTSFKMNKR